MKKKILLSIFFSIMWNHYIATMEQIPVSLFSPQTTLAEAISQRIATNKRPYTPANNIVYVTKNNKNDLYSTIRDFKHSLLIYSHEGKNTFSMKLHDQQTNGFKTLAFFTQNENNNFISKFIEYNYHVTYDCSLFIVPNDDTFTPVAKKILEYLIGQQEPLLVIKQEGHNIDLNFVGKHHQPINNHAPQSVYFRSINTNHCITIICGCLLTAAIIAIPCICLYKIVDRALPQKK